jgi:lysyl-tRNA synthetase class 2
MKLTQKLFKKIASELGLVKITFKGVDLDFSKPFKKINMVDFIKQEAGVNFDREIKTDEEALALAKKFNIKVEDHQRTRGHIINLFFEEFCEKKCQQPTFVYGHPIEISPLAKKHEKDPRYTERFELFICGKEFANSFTELNDPIDQYERFKSQVEESKKGNDEANEMDLDFVEALEYGMPPTGGIGIGIDRLTMMFTNNESIRNVLLFPHMRDRGDHE